MASRRKPDRDLSALLARVDGLEKELRAVRRQAAADRAQLSEGIELAIAPSLHTSTLDLIDAARAVGWGVHFGRRRHGDARGTIYFEHPDNPDYNTRLEFPLPDDDLARRRIEIEVRIRLDHCEAA